ncbi:Fanconi anemia core complex-associated protein 100 [Polymixia lowei]
MFIHGTDVLLCDGSDELHVFSMQEKKLTATLHFPGPVCDMVQSLDKQLLYAACEDEVYCVNLPFLLSRVPSSLASLSSSPAVLEISSDCLYKTPASVQSTARSHEKVAGLSLTVVSAGLHEDVERNQRRRPGGRPVVVCVHSNHEQPSSSSSSSMLPSSEAPLGDGHFLLEPVLFKLLFGADAALAKSPIILCGLPDGRLCFLPLRLPGSRVQVLHGLEQPVAFIGTSVAAETSPGGPRCLVVVGGRGRVVLVGTCEGPPEVGGKVAGFTEGCVSGPVVCGRVDGDHLYYSTGSDLLALDLAGGPAERAGPGWGETSGHGERRGGGEETSSKTVPATLQSPVSLNVCRVVALGGPTHNAAGAVQLVGLSARGRLQRITLPKGRDDAGLSSLPSSQVGQRVRDLLAAIGDVCERGSALKSTIWSKNQVLSHLNQVLNISYLLLANQNSEKNLPVLTKPIGCHAVVRWSRLLGRDSLNLTCVLENSSPYILEQGWTFCVTVVPLTYSLTAGGESSSRTFSFPFQNLHSGETFEVSLPLATAGDTSFPVTVICSLVFSLRSLLGQEELASLLANGDAVTSRLGLDGSCVSLPVDTLTVDWLDALRVSGTANSHKNATSRSADTVTVDTIEAFLSSRRVRCPGTGEGRAEKYSASVRVSSELLNTTLALKAPDVDLQGPKAALPSLCVSVLDWLLTQGPGGGETGPRGDVRAQGSSVVHAQSPGGHTVKLTAREVTTEEESGTQEGGAPAAVEVKVESSSMAAVCGLHHALLCRVQTLLQRAPEKTPSTMRQQGLGLRWALQQAEALLQQIQQSRIPEAFGAGLSTGKMTQSLLSVYQQLRENPLLII